MKLNRRAALGLFGASTCLAASGAAAAIRGDGQFLHGVASGDPLQDRVILWTRVTPADEATTAVPVQWEIATDETFATIAAQGVFETGAVRDFTVKVDATGLSANTDYWYRFRSGQTVSPVGRTRTLPSGEVSDVVLAVASCSLYTVGHFNAYRDIAALERVDVVLHLGDYIYEYGSQPGELAANIGERIGRFVTPPHEARTLADYRERHACYKRDEDLQAAHARAAWICVWDDHDVANDSWVEGAQNHTEGAEGVWPERRDAAIRAFYEWVPIRDPEPGVPLIAANRTFELGNLATLIMVENRLLGRDQQIILRNPDHVQWDVWDNGDPDRPVRVTDAARYRAMMAMFRDGLALPEPYSVRVNADSLRRSIARPERSIFGHAQKVWLKDQLEASVAAGKPWQVLGNQMVMARTTGVDLQDRMGPERWAHAKEVISPILRPWVTQLETLPRDVPFEFDGWNAYPAARERMDQMFAQTGARPLVLSGDSHAFWINELSDASGQRVAAEVGVSSITSSSLGNMLGHVEIGPFYAEACPEVRFCQMLTKGYGLVTLRADVAEVQLIGVSTVTERTYERFVVSAWRLRPDPEGGVQAFEQIPV